MNISQIKRNTSFSIVLKQYIKKSDIDDVILS